MLILIKIFLYFVILNSRNVAKNPSNTSPYEPAIKYDQCMRYLSLWFGVVLNLSPEEFKQQYGSQSCSIGSASAASNAVISADLWGQPSDWVFFNIIKRYEKLNTKFILSVSIISCL